MTVMRSRARQVAKNKMRNMGMKRICSKSTGAGKRYTSYFSNNWRTYAR